MFDDLTDLFDMVSKTKSDTSFVKILNHDPVMMLGVVGNTIATRLKLDLENGPWMAGGSVRKCFLNQPIGFSDWDVFFKNKRQFDEARNSLSTIRECHVIFESSNAITFQIHDYGDQQNPIYKTPIKVQLICRNFYDSCEELLEDFDFTICQFATDGLKFKLGRNTYLDNIDGVLKLTSPSMYSRPGFMSRVIKYITYGYKPSKELLEIIDNNFEQLDFTTRVDEYEF
jgi:hypothetical protein